MVLIRPATVIQRHYQGFRLFWRWLSRSGRPLVDREIRNMIWQMNAANPLWGAPRIHGELLKRDIEISSRWTVSILARIYKTRLRLGSVMAACENFLFDFFNGASHEGASSFFGAAAG
jgi:hypothetical protein